MLKPPNPALGAVVSPLATPCHRGVLGKIVLNAREDGFGNPLLVTLVIEPFFFLGIANKGGFYEDGRYIRGFENRKASLLDLILVQGGKITNIAEYRVAHP